MELHVESAMNREEELKLLIRRFLELIGEDPDREGLRETPSRVAKMWLNELTRGYRVNPKEYVKVFEVDEYVRYRDLVIIKDVPVKSICEHHLLPFFGYAHVAYIPSERVLGFSKFARIVDAYSKRLQLQERLTEQVADFLMDVLRPKGLLLVIEAIHTCALVRGIEEPMFMATLASRGVFKDNEELRLNTIKILKELPIRSGNEGIKNYLFNRFNNL